MDKKWHPIALRMVQGLGVQPGELIDVRDSSGCQEALLETALAIETVGATPLIQLVSPDYLARLWDEVPLQTLAQWDRHRQDWMREVDRVLVLAGARPDFSLTPRPGREAWDQAQYRLTVIEEERRLPYLLAAIPTEPGARQLGLSLDEFEAVLLPALCASVEQLQQEIARVLAIARGDTHLTLHSGDSCVLHLDRGDRPWLSDDGCIDDEDRRRGAIVSNLPAGSVYTTVLEDQTQGSLWLPKAGAAQEVVFYFADGRVVEIEAPSGADQLIRELDSHSGEPRRISHIGLGLNPSLHRPVGWTLVDEHVHGHLFLALGENQYMGGQNESSINVDYALSGATLLAGERTIVSQGKVVA
jgi:leucyl aminopeptidase (aminopeptidase T)